VTKSAVLGYAGGMIRAAFARTSDPDWPDQDGPPQAEIIARNSLSLRPLPRWTRIQGEHGVQVPDAAFAAGAALFALDQIVRADPPWLGALRMRQALAAAAVSARLLRLRADEAALRDAHHLTRPGDDPGPAGRLYRAWRDLAARPARLEAVAVARLAQSLGLADAENLFDRLRTGEGSSEPIAGAAEMAARVSAAPASQGLEGELLGMMLADVTLAQKLGWRAPVPLLATAILHPALKSGPERRRARPGDPGWPTACQAIYALAASKVHAQAIDLARRGDRLLAGAGKVRTRGGATGIGVLLADDAVAATALDDLGSDRAARRFLERLASFGAIRELTGRPTFRLYGL
jgi:hypothetical protein